MKRILLVIITVSMWMPLWSMNEEWPYSPKLLQIRDSQDFDVQSTQLLRLQMEDPNANATTVAELLLQGANPNDVDGQGYTPLLQALRNNCSHDVITTLVQSGADIHHAKEVNAQRLASYIQMAQIQLENLERANMDENKQTICLKWIDNAVHICILAGYAATEIAKIRELDLEAIQEEVNPCNE